MGKITNCFLWSKSAGQDQVKKVQIRNTGSRCEKRNSLQLKSYPKLQEKIDGLLTVHMEAGTQGHRAQPIPGIGVSAALQEQPRHTQLHLRAAGGQAAVQGGVTFQWK